jgi:exopolyphosphatase/guanosine-5'-triphosphate,3'-diphosphate pyrophosphatase
VSLTIEAFSSDPPKPEELTNAIGAVVDHLDDMLRALPAAVDADGVGIVGEHAAIIAAVEFGGDPPLPFSLGRAAAEEVFRTVATESAHERARNPGLPPDAVNTIVGACCIVVALMRHLHLDQVDVGRPA